MQAMDNSKRRLALGFTTAMAAALLAGCAAGSAPRADVSASAAAQASERGNHDSAIQHAEAAVVAAPHSAEYRLVLGNAYLDAGRFASAEAAFSDAMTLGDSSPRAALALALAQIAQAKYSSAATILADNESTIARADLGLALALAGQPERGIHVMSNAIRGGENTMKMRQNLAYAYAMAGRWREARLMAQQDVPAGEVSARLEQWARLAPSEAYQSRIAALIGVPAGVQDAGQPVHLALGNTPSVEQLAAEALAVPDTELAAIGPAPVETAFAALPAAAQQPLPFSQGSAPRQLPADFASSFAMAPEPETRLTVSEPVVQAAPARQFAEAPPAPAPRAAHQRFADEDIGAPTLSQAPAPARALAPARAPQAAAEGTHLVQLGSFLSEAGARRAWNIYQSRYPELQDREMVITEAVVNGRHFWRVSAGGYDQMASRAMCSRVRSSGNAGCISWAAARPLPGALDRGVRLARR